MGYKPAYGAFEPRDEERNVMQRRQNPTIRILEAFTHASTEGLGIADLEGKITYANPALGRMLGGDPDDFVGTNVRDYYREEDLQNLEKNVLAAVSMKTPQKVEMSLISIRGKKTDVMQSVFLIEDEDGIPHFANVITDITDRKQAEEALVGHREQLEELVAQRTADLEKANVELQREIAERKRAEEALKEREARLRFSLDGSGDGTWEWNLRTGGILFSERAKEILGLDQNKREFRRADFLDFVHPDHVAYLDSTMKDIREGATETYKVEFSVRAKDQGWRWILSRGRVFSRTEGGMPESLFGTLSDITEQRRSEEVLQSREAKYRMLADNANDVIWTRDMDLHLTYVSPANERLRGYTSDEAMGQTLEETLTPSSYQVAVKVLKEELALETEGEPPTPRTRTMELEQTRKDGSTVWTEVKVSFLRDDEGHPIGILGVTRDISDRKETEDRLRESELKFRSIFDLSPQAISLTEAETGKLIDVNDKWCEMTALAKEMVIGRTTTQLGFISKSDRGSMIDELEKSGAVRRARDDSMANSLMVSKQVDILGKQVILNIFVDITERKRAEEERKQLEERLQQAQKMEAVGTLAGGIAHDFNNLLMGIQGNTSLMLLGIDNAHDHYDKLKSIEHLVLSGAKLTNQLLGYARKGKYEVKPIDLNLLVRESSETFGRTRKEITIHQELAENLSAIEVDQGQIQQVLFNLYVNAADAMPKGGDLFLRTANVTHEAMKGSLYDPKFGNYVRLTVTDTGVGMDVETKRRLFEPFFTTKEMGRGTGLGLASVYGIVKSHGGYIDVESERGKGTTFMVYLQATQEAVPKSAKTTPQVVEGSETILLVDDEEIIRKIGLAILEKMGYKVSLAQSGAEALAVYEKDHASIDLVILDMIMPDMNGGEVYDRLKEISPGAKTLLSSGYSIDGQATEILERGCDGFIQKPFNMEKLSQKIREVLDKE